MSEEERKNISIFWRHKKSKAFVEPKTTLSRFTFLLLPLVEAAERFSGAGACELVSLFSKKFCGEDDGDDDDDYFSLYSPH